MSKDYSKAIAQYQELKNERSEWEQEWRQISEYLLPGRGIYQTYAKPRKRKLTTQRVINTVAEDALYVLTSGMHGGLTSPSRPWFMLEWADPRIAKFEPLKAWLQQCDQRLHKGLHASNFYSVINSFYIEYAGFGTGSMYVGEDVDDVPFKFELLTAGEYAFSVGGSGKTDIFYRTIFMTPRQVVERFPDTASKEIKQMVKESTGQAETRYITVLECVYPEKYKDKPFTQVFYETTATGHATVHSPTTVGKSQDPLGIYGFYEFPYPVARWNTIGSDIYGVGPGSRALPDIKRLQQMEKAFLMATHKAINPPLNAPARMKGKLNTLPGGYNYYSNPQETVNELYQVRFDYQGVGSAVERVEQRIQRNFFNDIFLTAARDPNASPYKATEVNVREQEKMLRLGPVIERLQHEFLQPLIERCFNIMLRKEMFEPLPPDLVKMAGEYKISLISPLATAQRSVALQGINSFMAFIGQAAQFDPSILDNVDADAAAREFADITGVQLGVLRPQEKVKEIRAQRVKAQAAEQQRQQQMEEAQIGSQVQNQNAQSRKTSAEAATTMIEGQQLANQIGLM